MTEPITVSELLAAWEQVDALRRDEGLDIADNVPGNAFTQQEYMERYGVPAATAQCQLARLVKKGALATALTRRQHGGRLRTLRMWWKP